MNISHEAGSLSIPQLIRATVEQLEKDGKVKGQDFRLPSNQWVYMQFSPNNEYARTAGSYSGILPYVRNIISHLLRNGSHTFAH